MTAFAATGTAPTLGAASTYSVFGKLGVTNDGSATTHVWGNVGADATNVTGLNDGTQVDGVIDAGVGVEAALLTAYGQLAAQSGTIQSLSGTVSVIPGVYNIGADPLNGAITLNGAGVYIFKSTSSIATTGAAQMSLINGASACNVFWQIPAAMTIGAGAHIEGTIFADTELVSLAAGASLKGRAFSRSAQVTMITNQITEPTCVAAPTGSAGSGTINVVKTVINDNGGTKVVSDFPLFVDGGSVISGVTNSFPTTGRVFNITETSNPNYTRTYSGDCTADGHLFLNPGDSRFCVITNNDIGAPVVAPPVPPLIDVVKVPSPLALPNGPGSVMYTYTLKNIGTVPVTNITLVGDTCSPIVLASGDTNGDLKLDLSETWVHTCTTTLTETHTNNVVATGWANGLSATDIASATVIVGLPVVPPLIHVTKVPNPLTLLAGGGLVTYTEKITNPGTVALNNVLLVDDKCSPMKFISGDVNSDSKLDVSETWAYTCQSNLTETTTNTAIASGTANGITVRDFAIATVVVANAVPVVPTLPETGLTAEEKGTPWAIVALSSVLASSLLLFVLRKKQI